MRRIAVLSGLVLVPGFARPESRLCRGGGRPRRRRETSTWSAKFAVVLANSESFSGEEAPGRLTPNNAPLVETQLLISEVQCETEKARQAETKSAVPTSSAAHKSWS
jgi:hypothetical protein